MGLSKAQSHKLASRQFDVRRFVPVGEILHDANIDEAIDAAEAAARASVGPGLRGPGPVVFVPAGVWNMSAAHQFERFDDYRCAVGLLGEGRNETVFLLPSTGGGQPLFTFGSASATAVVPFAMNMYIGHFSICAATEDNCDWSGMRFYGCVNALVERVYVRGLSKPTATYSQGIACEVLPALENGVEVNSQFMVVRDCDFSVNMTGVYARLTYPITIENTHCQQNHFEDAIFEACLGSWKNSGAQFQGDAVLFPDRWHGQRKMPSIVTGFSRTTGLDSGTGATCAAASGNLCLVTGLSGLDAVLDRGRWLELTPAGSSANELKVRGVYKIESVASATSCYIRKGSNHTSQGTLTWQVREAQAGTDMVFEGLYDEGLNRAMFGFWRDSGTNGCFTVRHPLAVGQDYIVEADGVQKIIVDDPLYSNVADKIAYLRQVGQSRVEAPLSDIVVDDYSYPGLICLSDSLLVSGRVVNGWRDSNGVPDTRLRSIIERLGAVEMLDLRVASSVSLSGADVLSVTGLINGSQCLPSYSGREAQWDTADGAFDAPCIANVEGAVNTTGAGMRMTINSSALPDRPYTCTVVLIGRLESATPLSAEARRVEVRTSTLQQKLALADGTWVNDNLVLTEGSSIGGNVLTVLTPAVDTDAHCWIWGRHPNALNVISSDDGEDYRGNNAAFIDAAGHAPGEDLELRLADGTDATFVRPFRWAFVAVFARTLSHAETRQIMSAARNEFPLEP